MTDKKLRPKYLVFKIGPDGETEEQGMASTDPGNVDSPFVLMPRKDPAAFIATVVYARYCEKDLAAEIKEWLTKVVASPTMLGSQGERNRVHSQSTLIKDSLA